MPEEKKPEYVDQTIRLASAFLDANKDIEAGRLLRLLNDADYVGYRVVYNILIKQYGVTRIENAEIHAIESEALKCKRINL